MAGETRILVFAEGIPTSAPSQSFLTMSALAVYANDAAYVTAKGSAAAQGDAYQNSTDGKIHYYHTSWVVVEAEKNNFTAVVSPTVSDDSSLFYSKGSKWIDTVTDKIYMCVDNTVGAAIWNSLGGEFLGVSEFPSGTINGVNTVFSLNYTMITGTLHVLLNGLEVPNDKWSFVYPDITFDDAPVLGQIVEAKYLSNGASATLSLGTIERKVETHLITAGEITAKKIVLQQTPADPTEVTVNVRSGAPQAYGYDFEIINSNELSWNGLGLDGQIIAGSVLIIVYYF